MSLSATRAWRFIIVSIVLFSFSINAAYSVAASLGNSGPHIFSAAANAPFQTETFAYTPNVDETWAHLAFVSQQTTDSILYGPIVAGFSVSTPVIAGFADVIIAGGTETRRTDFPTPSELWERQRKTLGLPDVKERLSILGADGVGDTPQHFAAFIKAEIPKWAKVVRDAGLKIE